MSNVPWVPSNSETDPCCCEEECCPFEAEDPPGFASGDLPTDLVFSVEGLSGTVNLSLTGSYTYTGTGTIDGGTVNVTLTLVGELWELTSELGDSFSNCLFGATYSGGFVIEDVFCETYNVEFFVGGSGSTIVTRVSACRWEGTLDGNPVTIEWTPYNWIVSNPGGAGTFSAPSPSDPAGSYEGGSVVVTCAD